MIGDIFYGDRQGGVVTLHRHSQRVAHQQHINAFIGEQLREAMVVGGNGGKALLFLFAFLQQGNGGRFHNIS